MHHAYKPGATVTLMSLPPGLPMQLPADARLPFTIPIENGSFSLFPVGSVLRYKFTGRSSHNFVLFHWPCGVNAKRTSLRAMQPLGERFAGLNRSLEEAFAMAATNRLRAEIRLWDFLWQLSQDQPVGPWRDPAIHPVLRRAYTIIDFHLSRPLVVSRLARELDVSHNHLLRLFREHQGTTVLGYIRRQRVLRAKHLLRFTSLPIKEIAQQVGIPDLHHFNKTLRRETGKSPTALRR
ncbi:MAG: AraC family transcriptional regulator [Deltaproteobacteria bacterium]|nr:AraC family transcriptional regulator [Deltaproteobacteria bacterium]